MQTFIEIIRPVLALAMGGAIGYSFGLIQSLAQRRNTERERSGKLTNGWSLMPGSGARVAYLLISLLIIQVICPMLFAAGTQWWVSGGLAAGYGWVLFRQLQQRRAQGF